MTLITLNISDDINYFIVSFNNTILKISKKANKVEQVIAYLKSQCNNLIII